MKRVVVWLTSVLVFVSLLLMHVSPSPAQDAAQPVKGGTLKAMRVIFPKNIGYVPEWAPADIIAATPWAERLVHWDEKGGFVPILLESWKIDPNSKVITLRIKKGVKFSDGTSFDAESLKANLDLNMKASRVLDGQFIKSIEIADPLTVKLILSELTSISMLNYVFNSQMVSVAALEKGGKDWARLNGVGTGPFKLADFKRDTYIKYVRNDNYWRKGLPYLDGISIDFVPDAVTASMKMEAREMDMWMDVPNIKIALDLQQKGFKINWGIGMLFALIPNSNKPRTPDAPLTKKQVREAIEYAIDRPAVAKAVGFGQYEPLTQLVPSFSPAYVPKFNPRPYNPEKAKQLLAEAGYPKGVDLKLICQASSKDAATAIQQYLGEVGIRITIDVADDARYAASMFSPQGWDDLALAGSGIHPSGTDIYQHFGPRPLTYRFDYIKKTPEYLATCDKALHTYNDKDVKKAMQEIVKRASEDAMVIPIFRSAQANVMQPYVHTEYAKRNLVQWSVWEDWMGKH
jgi:peptide/nickel transport system substrate-binding protein